MRESAGIRGHGAEIPCTPGGSQGRALHNQTMGLPLSAWGSALCTQQYNSTTSVQHSHEQEAGARS